jgi:hypothetical protein
MPRRVAALLAFLILAWALAPLAVMADSCPDCAPGQGCCLASGCPCCIVTSSILTAPAQAGPDPAPVDLPVEGRDVLHLAVPSFGIFHVPRTLLA